ncbi:hypothetical protein BDN72DRAFT_891661 [Pluteus cervinus]|uniref:Uncharacterized protein n=1 Tax=Pluteus cervinus TaxID=181527 RepID=A0ACD3BDW2_9AGAR|nr:hypothetical protein BDN72DRAFT_891661 [Pluteus cervinus]
MRPSSPLVLIATLLAAAHVAAKEVRLFHRIVHPALPQVEYRERGVLVLDPNVQSAFRPSTALAQDLSFFAETLQNANVDLDTALYQVALERADDASESTYDISSVKVCHLHKVSQETIVLHTNDPRGTDPYALDYFVSPIPHDGACPPLKKAKSNTSPGPSPLQSLAGNIGSLNSTVAVRTAHVPPL